MLALHPQYIWTQYLKYFCVLFIDKIVMSLLENPLLGMKFDLEIPIFKVNNVSSSFETILYVLKTSSFA